MQRRERSQPPGYPQHMIHLSDLETSDSTRQSLKDPGMLTQHKKVHTQPTSLSYPTRTDNYRQLHQAEHVRVNQELMHGASAFIHTGARPKHARIPQTLVLPPVVPPPKLQPIPVTEHAHVTQANSQPGNSTNRSTLSKD